jgi:uncharacterized membrane protein YphA (DoxX/SURF4 family)
MATTMKGQSMGGGRGGAYGLRALAFLLGVFFVFNALDKLAWFGDSGILTQRLEGWLQDAAPSTRWYIETVAAPGVPLFARLVPLAELSTGVALILGFWTRMVAVLAFLMVANLHFARGFFYEWEFLMDGAGFPVLGGLLALAIGGTRLPFSASS